MGSKLKRRCPVARTLSCFAFFLLWCTSLLVYHRRHDNHHVVDDDDGDHDVTLERRAVFVRQSRRISSYVAVPRHDDVIEVVGDDDDVTVTLDDVFVSVKTSGKFHETRVKVVLDTWFRDARKQTYIFSDENSERLSDETDGHFINTRCNSSHTRRDLSCKTGVEFDTYVRSEKKWWCHFDDDNYVNVDRLVALLNKYDWRKDVYLGKPSISRPFQTTYRGAPVKFTFATGGAGLCISRSLAEKMTPWCGKGKLRRTSDALRAPDDCTLGFVATNRIGVNLTRSESLHSHLEVLADIHRDLVHQQVTLSYGVNNVVRMRGAYFPVESDPTRFYSVHCRIRPTTPFCRNYNSTKFDSR